MAVVKGLAEDYTRLQLVVLRKAATDAVMAELPRVEITGANFETGGQSGEFIKGQPEKVAEYAHAAIQYLDEAVKRNDSVVFGDFSRRRAGW
jgi:hypothetical protein